MLSTKLPVDHHHAYICMNTYNNSNVWREETHQNESGESTYMLIEIGEHLVLNKEDTLLSKYHPSGCIGLTNIFTCLIVCSF